MSCRSNIRRGGSKRRLPLKGPGIAWKRWLSLPGVRRVLPPICTVAGQLRSNHARGLQAIGKKVDDQIDQLKEAVAAIQRGMRVVAIGVDYARYNRFEQLTPSRLTAG
jgi:hypothetical protein